MAKEPDPFFLYLPFQNIHSPYTCDQVWYNKYAALNASGEHTFNEGEMTMFGYMTEMDAAVGDVMTAFHKTGKYENSYTIFSSDNGAPPAGAVGPDGDVNHMHSEGHGQYIRRNYPYRGWKTQIWDGGVRVAGFIHSPLLPAKVKGTVSHELYHVTDWLPTIASLTGASTDRWVLMVVHPGPIACPSVCSSRHDGNADGHACVCFGCRFLYALILTSAQELQIGRPQPLAIPLHRHRLAPHG